MRLYWSQVLRHTRYFSAAVTRDAPVFRFQLIRHPKMLGTYEVTSLDELYNQLKADGHIIWGHDDILDYVIPESAWELLVLSEVLKARGYSIEGITEHLGFNCPCERSE